MSSKAVAVTAFLLLTIGGIGLTVDRFTTAHNPASAAPPVSVQYQPIADDGQGWKQFFDSRYQFSIEYPTTTEPETQNNKEPGIIKKVAFAFEQPFHKGEDMGTLKFQFVVSISQNAGHSTAEAWASEHATGKITTAIHTMQVAGRTGATVRTSNLAWYSVETFVADKDLMYELSYTDVTTNSLLPDDTRSQWVKVFDRMLASFRFLSVISHSK